MDSDDNLKFNKEFTSIWSFSERGKWATHKSDSRGNFAPQVPRNLILTYTKETDLILDPAVGSGTTLIEAKLLNRNAIGIDVNKKAIQISKDRLNFKANNSSKQELYLGDFRKLYFIDDESIDLIIFHPPYFDLVKYSNGENPDDLSSLKELDTYLIEIEKGIKELFRVLKQDKFCALLIGDTRIKQHYVPLSTFLLILFLKHGFLLKEEIIKIQHNTTYANKWKEIATRRKFFLILHEHLYVFRKPLKTENLENLKYSSIKILGSISD